MANTEIKKEEQEDQLENVENSLGKTEQYIENNKDRLLMILGAIVLVVVAVMAYNKYSKNKDRNAAAQMYMAEQYLERDSFNLALNGDSNYPGFLGIIKDYSGTAAANNAKYGAGVCYMNLGDFDNAIKMLDGFSSDDPALKPISIGLLGDAYMEKGQTDKAKSYYEKAANVAKDNKFIAPIYLKKLALLFHKTGDTNSELAAFEQIKGDYPGSAEAREAEKYIQACKMKLGK